MSNYTKIITAQDSAVSFLPKEINAHFGNAPKICVDLLKGVNKVLIVCTDQAYFSLGKRVKDCLVSESVAVSCFCLDSEVVKAEVLKKILQSEEDADCIIAVGEDALCCQVLLCGRDKRLIFLPLNFEFGLLVQSKKATKISLVFDDEVYSSLPKNKLLSGIKSVLSKNIVFVESAVYELIDGLLVKKEELSLLEHANQMLTSYYKTREIENLIRAQLYASFAVGDGEVENTSLLLASQIVDIEGLADFGEREYMFYQMLVKIYALYLNNDTSFLVKLPTAIECFENAVKGDGLKTIPSFMFDSESIAKFKTQLGRDERVMGLINSQLTALESNEQIFHAIYAGRKYTFQNYNQKQRAKALKQAPIVGTKKSLLKLIWADGVLEYL